MHVVRDSTTNLILLFKLKIPGLIFTGFVLKDKLAVQNELQKMSMRFQ